MLYQPSGRKGRTPQRHKYAKGYDRTEQSSPSLPDPEGWSLWARRPRLPHTQPRRTIVPKTVATPLAPAVHKGPISRRCGHTRRRSTPTPRGDAQTTHRPRAIVLSVLRRPTCTQSNTIGRNQTGMHPQQRKHIGASPPSGEDTPDRRQVQGMKKKGVHQQRVLC